MKDLRKVTIDTGLIDKMNDHISQQRKKALEVTEIKLKEVLSNHLGREATIEDAKYCWMAHHPFKMPDPSGKIQVPDVIRDTYYKGTFLGTIVLKSNIITFIPPEGQINRFTGLKTNQDAREYLSSTESGL